jgi:hypothetical protein
MGKRVDFSGRTVITADPNLSIAEVGTPPPSQPPDKNPACARCSLPTPTTRGRLRRPLRVRRWRTWGGV